MITIVLLLIAVTTTTTNAFVLPHVVPANTRRHTAVVRHAFGNNNKNVATSTTDADDELRRYDKVRRAADANARVVELVRPLGMVLNEDSQGNVYVEAIAPKGNAARSGNVQEGDIVTMCSATFGDQMWSTRGVGLSRVLAAIRVRAGGTVKLCLESPQENKRKAQMTKAQLNQMEEARRVAQEKKDRLLTELERDEQRLKKGKFLGLF